MIGGDRLYQARILDRDRQIKAVLPGIRWHYNRRINEATEISIYIPRETIDEHIPQGHALYGFFAPSQPFVVQGKPARAKPNKAQYAEIAAYIQIYKGDTLKVTGKINSRTIGQIVTIQAYTEEILLEGNQTPAQYGKVYDNWDLADVAKDMLDGWQTIRVKDQSQWQSYMVGSSNIDLTTDPGIVMLAKKADGSYYQSGYIELMFSSGEVTDFKRWDRIRWSADSEAPVKTTIQYSTSGISWSTPFDGGFPEEVGLVPSGATSSTMYVRINLETTDTESEDPDGNPVGVTPAVFAIELIARTERNELVAGNIPSVAGVTVKGLSADYASAFQVLLDACEQVGWEFQVWNGALNIAKNIGVDRTKDFVLRAGTNVEIQTLGDDDKELVNVLTAYGPGHGINRLEIALRDEESIAQFGEYPFAMEFDVEKLSELQDKAQEFLDEHNLPKTQFEVAVAFDHDKEPDYGLGDKVRVADPETGIVTTARIMAEAREYGESGLVVNLELGKAGLDLQAVLEGKPAKRPVDPFTPTGVWARGIVRGIRVGLSRPKGDWDSTEVHVSTAPGFVPSGGTMKDTGKQTQFDITDLEVGTRYYVRIVNVNSRGNKSAPSREVSAVPITMQEEQLKDYTDGVDDYVENISPVLLVSELPVLPDPRYPVGTIVFLITDEKLYRNDGENWVPLVSMNLEDLEGKLQSNQIALDAITEDLIAAEAIANRHLQLRAVTTPKIATGAITETKISDDAISTPKLKARAITANKIAANAITAGKIAAGAIETNHISAGAVKADQIDANAVTTSKILAGAVTAAKIAARTITAYEIATGAITANEIAARTITAAEIATGAITANKIAANAITAGKIQAGVVSYDKLDVEYARVTSALVVSQSEFGGNSYPAVQGNVVSAWSQDSWNTISFSPCLPYNIERWITIEHNPLSTLIGGYEWELSMGGSRWFSPGQVIGEFSYVLEGTPTHQVDLKVLWLRENRFDLFIRRVLPTGPDLIDLNIRFKRHSIS